MDPLTIALAIYGGYQGYTSAKRAHANTLGQLFATAAGAYGGYNLGSGVTGSEFGQEYLPSALTEKIVPGPSQILSNVGSGITGLLNPASETNLQAVQNQVPLGGVENIAQNTATGIPSIATSPQFQPLQPTVMNAAYTVPSGGASNYELEQMPDGSWSSYTQMQQPQVTPAAYNQPAGIKTVDPYAGIDDRGQLGEAVNYYQGKQPTDIYAGIDDLGQVGRTVDYGQYNPPQTMSEKLSEYGSKAGDILGKTFYDEKDGIKVGNAALVGVPTALYASGAFERKPYERSLFTYNVNYPDLYRNRTFQVQDPRTGQVYNMPQQSYIPEEKAKQSITNPNQQFGPYKREVLTLNQGGLASLAHFREGGVTYLPSKVQNDETNEDSYMRANGYVEDPTGAGDKNEDTMLAQLADGEFVTRTDGVLGAGILAGANPGDEKQMRKMGADFFYEQQKRFKRIFDLLDASRKATQH